MKRALVLILALLCVISFSGCKGKPKVLLDTDLLKVEQEGAKIHVCDVESNITLLSIYATKTRQKGLQSLIR